MIYLTRRERFSAAHRLHNDNWDDKMNQKVFGKCSNPNWHGHNYELFITVKGETNPKTGFVINLKMLGDIIKKEIIAKVDHKNLNVDVDFLNDKIPTTENLAIGIWNQLDAKIKELSAHLYCVKVKETENNYVEYFGN